MRVIMKGMKPRVYVETSVASYLTARRSRDLVVAAQQELTIEWWTHHRSRFDLFISEIVLDEAARGDVAAASMRLAELQGIDLLRVDDDARALAERFVSRGLIPARVADDALHIAVATTQGMDFLVTWNCKHIANAQVAERLRRLCRDLGFQMPALCTPQQLMGD